MNAVYDHTLRRCSSNLCRYRLSHATLIIPIMRPISNDLTHRPQTEKKKLSYKLPHKRSNVFATEKFIAPVRESQKQKSFRNTSILFQIIYPSLIERFFISRYIRNKKLARAGTSPICYRGVSLATRLNINAWVWSHARIC